MTNALFDEFDVTAGGQRAFGLLRTHGTSLKAMYAAVLDEVKETLPGLIPQGLYTTEQLCGPELWGSWPHDGQRRAAGMCLAHLVQVGAVALDVHKTESGKGPRHYVLRYRKVLVTCAD